MLNVNSVEPFSVVITSCRSDIVTLKSLPNNVDDVVVSRIFGLGRARNYGAAMAKNNLLVFLDDDLEVPSDVWNFVFDVNSGEFGMSFLNGFPCTRVFVIHKEDFWRVGGFDGEIFFTGEDRDFFVRALDYGLKFKYIPLCSVKHFSHEYRGKNIHVAIGSVKEDILFIIKYWRKHPKVFRVDFLDRLLRGQFRTLLLEFVFLLYFVVRGVKK